MPIDCDPTAKTVKEFHDSCRMLKRPTLDHVRQIFGAASLELLSNEYRSCRIPLAFRCERCGYVGRLRLGDLRKGSGCRRCGILRRSTARKLDFKDLKKELQERGIEVLSPEYVNSHTRCWLRCLKCEHKWRTTLNHIRRGSGCSRCYHLRATEKRTYSAEFVAKELAHRQIVLLSDYQMSKRTILVRFERCGHEVWTTWNQIQTGHGCQRCAPNARATKQDYRQAAERFEGRVLEIGSGAQDLRSGNATSDTFSCAVLPPSAVKAPFAPSVLVRMPKCFAGRQLKNFLECHFIGPGLRKCVHRAICLLNWTFTTKI